MARVNPGEAKIKKFLEIRPQAPSARGVALH
jgi:hypothetical protein